MIIIDTGVVSELMKPSPDPIVRDWVRTRRSTELYTTSITLAEIRYGIERLPVGRRRDLLRATESGLGLCVEHWHDDDGRLALNLVVDRGGDDQHADTGVSGPDVAPAWGVTQRCASSSRL